jgi:hypothetical protein
MRDTADMYAAFFCGLIMGFSLASIIWVFVT